MRPVFSHRASTFDELNHPGHVGEADKLGSLDLVAWQREWKPECWQKAMLDMDNNEMAPLIQVSAHTGRPLATAGILSKLEHKLGRQLQPLPVGSPRKATKKQTFRKDNNSCLSLFICTQLIGAYYGPGLFKDCDNIHCRYAG